MTAYKRIAQRRKSLKMSQEDLAYQIDSNQTQVSRYERGENDITGDVLIKIADALNTTVDYLLGRTDTPEMPLSDETDLATDEVEVVKVLRSKSPEARERLVNIIKELAKV